MTANTKKPKSDPIRRLERAGKFPARIRIGENRVGWRLADVEGWFAERPVVKYVQADDEHDQT